MMLSPAARQRGKFRGKWRIEPAHACWITFDRRATMIRFPNLIMGFSIIEYVIEEIATVAVTTTPYITAKSAAAKPVG